MCVTNHSFKVLNCDYVEGGLYVGMGTSTLNITKGMTIRIYHDYSWRVCVYVCHSYKNQWSTADSFCKKSISGHFESDYS